MTSFVPHEKGRSGLTQGRFIPAEATISKSSGREPRELKRIKKLLKPDRLRASAERSRGRIVSWCRDVAKRRIEGI